MLLPRLIPCLLIHKNQLYKSVNFKEYKYIGDPINTVRIFNEFNVDELIILDIDCTSKNLEPNYFLIERLAAEARMPICYGGGIKNINQAKKIFKLGVEKIALSSAAILNPEFIKDVGKEVGVQSVVVILDIKKDDKYYIYINNGTKRMDIDIKEYLIKIQEYGVGEIVLNSIDKDGLMTGYDLNLIKEFAEVINVPLTVLGGVGSYSHFKDAVDNFDLLGLAAGSFFVFKGKYRAVLLSYPNIETKKEIFSNFISKFYS
ncbi:putative imidazole glycerol phosphate synthase subunit hisF2 [Thermaurantimonas aggregans]|uniref:imidazole glycerol-phosphate synthase n=1 Tax=Thermaurantimonas aggregans TaxID=2173829 RepID=A0A401XJW6_9FLAO|nr:AglZ/HisF2 family acetamidino modification protein [Thermaurantimonas aggregans]MCX8148606.1 AglZ/HisF2 family acetamidino modification protein [Thermaurantimonas aggregans]GCD77325.1 putative imidazole glycerol phosphate synthase subunit hisF2 [Thermaurantimonas aggregans]